METYSAILTRRSVRKYTSEPVPPALLKRIITAAMYSPSARNNRPWEFIAVTERPLLRSLSDVRPYWSMLAGAGAAVVVLNNSASYSSPTVAFSVQDCAAATENLLLAAHDAGLGAVWLGLYPLVAEQEAVRRLLGIPAAVAPFAVVSLGYPASVPRQADRFEEEKLHWNQY